MITSSIRTGEVVVTASQAKSTGKVSSGTPHVKSVIGLDICVLILETALPVLILETEDFDTFANTRNSAEFRHSS